MLLYEQIIYELIEFADLDTAKFVLKDTLGKNNLHQKFPDRCLKMDQLIQNYNPTNTIKQLYTEGQSKESRRKEIVKLLNQEITVVPPSRLLYLLGDLLKYYEKDKIIQSRTQLNIFTGNTIQIEQEEEAIPIKLEKTLKYGVQAHIEVAKFSSQGKYLITGSVDGIIEVLDPITYKLRKDLPYQAEEVYMVHNEAVLSLAITNDDEMLASGSKNGQIKVWRIINGTCLRKFDNANCGDTLGIRSLLFTSDGNQVISASQKIRPYGMKSGKMLKEIAGHENGVADIILNKEGTILISGGLDGFLKIWDYKTTSIIQQFRPITTQGFGKINEIISFNMLTFNDKTLQEEECFLVCTKANILQMMNFNGKVLKQYKCEKKEGWFEAAALSFNGGIIYGFANDGNMYCFKRKTGEVIHMVMNLNAGEVLGMQHHTRKNLIALYNIEGDLKFYRS